MHYNAGLPLKEQCKNITNKIKYSQVAENPLFLLSLVIIPQLFSCQPNSRFMLVIRIGKGH